MCQTLMFINANSDAFLGYNGWGAGGFSPTTYVLTETPFSTVGPNGTTFTDQDIVTQCVVGTFAGSGIASKHKRSIRTKI
jgi:endoglucanase